MQTSDFERAELVFDKSLMATSIMNNLIASQHYEAAGAVGKQLTDELLAMKSELTALKAKFVEYTKTDQPPVEVPSPGLQPPILPEATAAQ